MMMLNKLIGDFIIIIKIFKQTDVVEVGYYRKAHLDGITWIEICEEKNFFATSSFDCCCYIWSFKNNDKDEDEVSLNPINQQIKYKLEIYKVGCLILGQDKNWSFCIDEESRRMQALEEAEEMLDKVKVLNSIPEDLEDNPTQRQKKGSQKTSQKLLDVLHERAFSNKKTTDIKLQFSAVKEEQDALDARVRNARKALDVHYNMKKVCSNFAYQKES